jgi:hypothetical protein
MNRRHLLAPPCGTYRLRDQRLWRRMVRVPPLMMTAIPALDAEDMRRMLMSGGGVVQ